MALHIHVVGVTTALARNAGALKFHRTAFSFQDPENTTGTPALSASRRKAALFRMQLTAAERTSPVMAPFRPQSQVVVVMIGKEHKPAHRLTRAMAPKASRPERIPT